MLDRTKKILDWLQHGYLLVQVASSLGVGKFLRAILLTYTHLSPIWISPLWLMSSALMFALMVAIGNYFRKRQEQQQQSPGQAIARALISTPLNFDAAGHFKAAYKSALTDEVEKNIKVIANSNQPHDREGFFAKFIGIGLVAYWYDIAWAYIFKSQLLLLMELNRHALPLDAVKSFYSKAVNEYPDMYRDFSFEAWLAFLKTNVLVIQQPDNLVVITERGQDFLKYLTHWGRYPDGRKY